MILLHPKNLHHRIKPRHFSIASAAPRIDETRDGSEISGEKVQGPVLDLCVARAQWKTRYGRVKQGLASSWLCDSKVGSKVLVLIRQGPARVFMTNYKSSRCDIIKSYCLRGILAFFASHIHKTHYRYSPPPPLILIGPGTGIAPMRAMVQECEEFCLKRTVILFTGFRHADKDHLYGDEMLERLSRSKGEGGQQVRLRVVACSALHPSKGHARPLFARVHSCVTALTRLKSAPPFLPHKWGGLDEYFPAFSRDTPGRRVYLHSLMLREKDKLRRLLLEEGACVFVSGSATSGLPEDTRKTLIELLGGVEEVRF